MTKAEAEKFIEGSKYTDNVYHMTLSKDTAKSIAKNGFDLERVVYGRMWGDGVYAALDVKSANLYRHSGRVSLTMKIKVENPYVVKNEKELNHLIYKSDIAKRASQLEGPGVGAGAALALAMKEKGHDSFIIDMRGGPRYGGLEQRGGNQIVVFDPKKVVVIKK